MGVCYFYYIAAIFVVTDVCCYCVLLSLGRNELGMCYCELLCVTVLLLRWNLGRAVCFSVLLCYFLTGLLSHCLLCYCRDAWYGEQGRKGKVVFSAQKLCIGLHKSSAQKLSKEAMYWPSQKLSTSALYRPAHELSTETLQCRVCTDLHRSLDNGGIITDYLDGLC